MSVDLVPVPAHGPEDVVVGPEGEVYTGTEDGSIWRISADRQRIERVVHTCGRPLGLELDDDGTLVVCDTTRGLLRADPATGVVTVLADAAGGVPLLVCNNAALARDGTIWFSDSSTVHPITEWRQDFGRNTRTGRLLRRHPDGRLEVVLTGLAFANGVELATDESFVTVAESGGRTLVRHWLSGPRAGTTDLLVPELPGYPDNVSRGTDGLIWVVIATPFDRLIDAVHRSPRWLRRVVTSVPEWMQPRPARGLHLQAYDDTGRLVHDVRRPDVDYLMPTGVREHHGTLWVGGLLEAAVATTRL